MREWGGTENKMGGERKDCIGRKRGCELKKGMKWEDCRWDRKKGEAQTNASLGNRRNQLSQSAND